MIAAFVLLFGLALFPNLVTSNPHPDHSLTVYNAASSQATLRTMALIALIGFGIVLLFVSIPGANVIYGVLGLVIFGGFTIFDFNRLRRANMASAVPIAAGIFLDIFNVFLLMLRLLGGGRS